MSVYSYAFAAGRAKIHEPVRKPAKDAAQTLQVFVSDGFRRIQVRTYPAVYHRCVAYRSFCTSSTAQALGMFVEGVAGNLGENHAIFRGRCDTAMAEYLHHGALLLALLN
jgi:hypothetical protein